MVFAPLTRRKHSPRRDTMSGARVSAPRLSSFIFFYLTASLSSPSCLSRCARLWLVFISFRESNSHRVSQERELSVQRSLRNTLVACRFGAGDGAATFTCSVGSGLAVGIFRCAARSLSCR
jgi:hypothetical protein